MNDLVGKREKTFKTKTGYETLVVKGYLQPDYWQLRGHNGSFIQPSYELAAYPTWEALEAGIAERMHSLTVFESDDRLHTYEKIYIIGKRWS